jgi:uncharacterized metal-binding protein
MSNYRTHSTLNLCVALPVLAGAGALVGLPLHNLAIFAAVFCYGTLFASPDLDMANQLKILSVRGILGLPFRSYARVFSHRGLSHSFFVGTLTRVAWLAAQAAVILLLVCLVCRISPLDHRFTAFFSRHRDEIAFGLAGLCAADWCHLLVDRFWPTK